MDWLAPNIFQKLIRQWDRIHPYNAGQVLQIAGTPDLPRLRSAWRQALDLLGIGTLHVQDGLFRHESADGCLPGETLVALEPQTALAEHIAQEMNCPFGQTEYSPFRPFILPQSGSFYAGITYQHWIADSVSVRMLLHEWFASVYDPKRVGEHIRHPTGGYWSLLGPDRSHWHLDEGLLHMLRWSARLRYARRVEHISSADPAVRFAVRQAPDGLIEHLRVAARRHHATVNDLFMAAMAEACDKHVPARRRYNRRSLAVGSIVDLRPYSKTDLSGTFGLFLGFTNVICRPKDMVDFPHLLRSITEQNARQKRRRAPTASAVSMATAVAAGRVLSKRQLLKFYSKRMPLAGGISNVNLNRSWPARYHPDPLLDYIRVSPTGPFMPLVFTPTTLGSRMNLALTWRASIISDEQLDAAADTFLGRLQKIAEQ